jgi:DNA-directed RNA polymerase specialized sigma24 family protein
VPKRSRTPARAVDAVWRIEAPRLVAALARMTGDVGTAEDLAQDALVAALEQWPTSGVPDNPAAWLMSVAKRRGIDHFRRADTLRRKTAEVGHGVLEAVVPQERPAADDLLGLRVRTVDPGHLALADDVVHRVLGPVQAASVEEHARRGPLPDVVVHRLEQRLGRHTNAFFHPDESHETGHLNSLLGGLTGWCFVHVRRTGASVFDIEFQESFHAPTAALSAASPARQAVPPGMPP